MRFTTVLCVAGFHYFALLLQHSGCDAAQIGYQLSSGGPDQKKHLSLVGTLDGTEIEQIREKISAVWPEIDKVESNLEFNENLIGTFPHPLRGFNKAGPFIVHLDSEGGSFDAGLDLAAFFYKYGISTVVNRNAICLSACAVAFMGGTTLELRDVAVSSSEGSKTPPLKFPVPFRNSPDAFEVRTPNRLFELGGRLGFHAPYLRLTTNDAESLLASLLTDPDANLEPLTERIQRQAKELRRLALDSLDASLKQVARLIQLSEQLSVPRSLIIEMLEKGPQEYIEPVTVDNAGAWSLGLAGYNEIVLSAREDARQFCLNQKNWLVTRSHITTSNHFYAFGWVQRDLESRQSTHTFKVADLGKIKIVKVLFSDGSACVIRDFGDGTNPRRMRGGLLSATQAALYESPTMVRQARLDREGSSSNVNGALAPSWQFYPGYKRLDDIRSPKP